MATDIHEAAAIEWRSRCADAVARVAELEAALGHAQAVAGRFMLRGHAGFEYDGISDELAITLQELSLIRRLLEGVLDSKHTSKGDEAK